MQNDKVNAQASSGASISRVGEQGEQAQAHGVYTARCYDADGKLKWEDTYSNLVLTSGKHDILDKYLGASAYTAAFYLGLISSVGYSAIVAGDTMASHAGWTEAGIANAPTYSQAARPTAAWSAAAAGAKSLSAPLTFSITGIGTIKGSFLATTATKDGTAGICFSAGLFSGGDREVAAGDTITVSYSLSI